MSHKVEIPEFASESEEADWWDKHGPDIDTSDWVDDPSISLAPGSRTHLVYMRLSDRMILELESLAGLDGNRPYQFLIQSVLKDYIASRKDELDANIQNTSPMYKLFRKLFDRHTPEEVQAWGRENWPKLRVLIDFSNKLVDGIEDLDPEIDRMVDEKFFDLI